MTKGHIISELTLLHKILCFPACGTINIKATLQGEIFSGENSELGRECERPVPARGTVTFSLPQRAPVSAGPIWFS